MVDALGGVFGVQRIPVRGFIGVNRGGRGNNLLDKGEAVRLCPGHGGNCPALPLTGDDDNAALPSLMLSKAPVNPVFLAVRRTDVAAKVSAIDLDGAGKRGALDFERDGFAELVS